MEEEQVFKHVCKFCSKSFPCGRSLGGHMRSPMNINNNSVETDCSTSMSEIEQKQEHEEVALSLMMLSRDVGHWLGLNSVVGSSENDSMFLKAGIQMKSKSGFEFIRVDRPNMKKSQTRDDIPESGFCKDPCKRSKFQCTTCKKIFHSYQALGGHRANHKKGKGRFGPDSSETETNTAAAADGKVIKSNDNEISIANLVSDRYRHGVVKKNKGRECPICLKVFQSGQALGGHKRSHLVAEAKENRTRMLKTRSLIPEFLDLNVPGPVEEGTSVHIGFKPWWVGTSHKHEPFLGLIFN